MLRLLLMSLLLLGGCVGTSPEPSSAQTPPGPATFRATGTLTMNLTPQLVAQTGLPQTITGSLHAEARSEAVTSRPLRSRHEGSVKLTFTGDNNEVFAELEINVDGESDGAPSQGLANAIQQLLDAASALTRIPSESAPSSASPGP